MAPLQLLPLFQAKAVAVRPDVAAPPIYDMSPRGSEGSGDEAHDQLDAVNDIVSTRFPIEVEFASFLPPWRSRRDDVKSHSVATPTTIEELLDAGIEDQLELREDVDVARVQWPPAPESMKLRAQAFDVMTPRANTAGRSRRGDEPCGDDRGRFGAQSFAIEEEFAAFTAAQALSQLGPGRSEAEAAWKLCLMREKLKCLQRSRPNGSSFTWAPALSKGNNQASRVPDPPTPPRDESLWPSFLPVLVEEEAQGGDEDGRAREERGAPPLSARRPPAPPASDPFFHFGEIDAAEERIRAEQQALVVEAFGAWRFASTKEPRDR